ncbi:unnamed protein product [Ilex paraguariensis]|uniref:Uncharacterized protein n=1 Tax=Ilex paraguariensis TaxID=185542 RepID=A0ABC8UNX5_9AQUA
MAADTTNPSYWLNWRFLLCAIWILTSMIVAALVIWKYEGFNKLKSRRRDVHQETVGSLYRDEAWRACLKAIHPAWLLAYRVIAFSVLLAMLVANVVIDGGDIFYFYTQWTFALVTFYFGLGLLLSIYGCSTSCKEVGSDRVDLVSSDAEQGTYMAPALGGYENQHDIPVSLNSHSEPHVRKAADPWGYAFQIIFQMCAGAVILTDCVFWFVIYPFLTDDDYKLDFLIVGMHSMNAVFLFGDVILNCLRFPFFRIAYFVLWTCTFVIFQWIIHACVSMWWPYSFLDLSSPYAPLWYLAVGLLHLPCYCIFTLIIRIKNLCLSRSFPESH